MTTLLALWHKVHLKPFCCATQFVIHVLQLPPHSTLSCMSVTWQWHSLFTPNLWYKPKKESVILLCELWHKNRSVGHPIKLWKHKGLWQTDVSLGDKSSVCVCGGRWEWKKRSKHRCNPNINQPCSDLRLECTLRDRFNVALILSSHRRMAFSFSQTHWQQGCVRACVWHSRVYTV